jgi:hypothetical protein
MGDTRRSAAREVTLALSSEVSLRLPTRPCSTYYVEFWGLLYSLEPVAVKRDT